MNKYSKFKNFNTGFTLAEVLITLGVIGVVAAITLSAVIKNYQKFILKQQIRNSYRTILTSLTKTIDYDNEPMPDSVTAYRNFNNKFIENLNVVKKCNGRGVENGCIPNYDPKYIGNNGSCPEFRQVFTTGKSYVLADGSILFEYGPGVRPIYAVDVNGHKGPNKPGFDLYILWTNTRKPILYSHACLYNEHIDGKDRGAFYSDNVMRDLDKW